MKQEFLNRMKEYLKDEYEDYLKTLNQKPYKGIRVNLLKTQTEEFTLPNNIQGRPSPFCKEGYVIDSDEKLGKEIEHLQGLFYIQEPSATSAVEILDVQKGDWVLDLCAAPGGKSTQIASKLQNTGFLLSNEVNPQRCQILLSNMERCGVSEAMITNSSVEVLCQQVQGWFDKVLVDAPCSGEGMFKKEDQALMDWSIEHVASCAIRQNKILDHAYKALKENGILVYSTCTYSKEENEGVINDFLMTHPDMKLIDCNVSFGRDGFDVGCCDGKKVRRIFPMDQGEGHFIAKMQRTSPNPSCKKVELKSKVDLTVTEFIDQQLHDRDFYYCQINDKVLMKKTPFIKLDHVKQLRQGILVGQLVKKRLEPHQHFYVASALNDNYKKVIELTQSQVEDVMKGLTLSIPYPKGYVALFYRHHPVGFGKSDGTIIKNKYPKGLRI